MPVQADSYQCTARLSNAPVTCHGEGRRSCRETAAKPHLGNDARALALQQGAGVQHAGHARGRGAAGRGRAVAEERLPLVQHSFHQLHILAEHRVLAAHRADAGKVPGDLFDGVGKIGQLEGGALARAAVEDCVAALGEALQSGSPGSVVLGSSHPQEVPGAIVGAD